MEILQFSAKQVYLFYQIFDGLKINLYSKMYKAFSKIEKKSKNT